MSEATKALRGLGKGGAVPPAGPNPAGSGPPVPPAKEKSGAQKRKEKREAEAAARQGAGPAPQVANPSASPSASAAAPPPPNDGTTWAGADTHEKFSWALRADPDALRRFFASPMGKLASEKMYAAPWCAIAAKIGNEEVIPPAERVAEGAEALRWCVDVYMPNLRRFGPLIALGSCLIADGAHAWAVTHRPAEIAEPKEDPTKGRGVEEKKEPKK